MMKKGEKVMDRLQSQKENKAGILEDMLSFIRYTPNREADILAFMEKYQKADHGASSVLHGRKRIPQPLRRRLPLYAGGCVPHGKASG